MIEQLKKTVEVLKQRIRYNLELIHQNENTIKEILKEPVSEIRSQNLNQRFNYNKKLLTENNEAIKLQRDILNYLDKYNTDMIEFIIPESGELNLDKELLKTKVVEISKEDYFELTINGQIDFDNRHPFFNDEDFLNDLFSYFISVEDYEMCNQLKKLNKNLSLK